MFGSRLAEIGRVFGRPVPAAAATSRVCARRVASMARHCESVSLIATKRFG